MIITAAALEALRVGFSARFQEAYGKAMPVLSGLLATPVPTGNVESMTYGWLLQIPRLRKWIGDRVIQNLAEQDFTVKNEPFELTVAVQSEKIRRDQLGVYNPLIDMLGQQAKMWPDDRVIDLIENGETTLCFDGQNFFDTDHPVAIHGDEGTQSNLFAAKPLTKANYMAGRASMRGWKGEDNRPLGVRPTHLIVPPSLEEEGLDVLKAERDANGATNTARGTAELVVVDELEANPTHWYLADASKPIKPFVFQTEVEPEFVSLDAPTNEAVFSKREYRYGIEAWGNAGFGPWFLIAKFKG
jgi:phage major head subunit gpT-like protein